MTEIWMKKRLVSDNNCNTVNLQCPIIFITKNDNNVKFTFSVSDTTQAV